MNILMMLVGRRGGFGAMAGALVALSLAGIWPAWAEGAPEIRTPAAPAEPRINGPAIFGVRPGNPFLYHIPATGDRPMVFSVDKLPSGLTINPDTGDISGVLAKKGTHKVVFHARNARGTSEKPFKIVVGETIALTPAMGWNSWNHYAGRITQEIVLENAKAMADSGLREHGWTYINIDDTWQGTRGGAFQGLQGNEKFPDIKGLCDAIHGMGLKFGIYSTPWETSYAGFPGGSTEQADGTWTKYAVKSPRNRNQLPYAIAKYHWMTNDASQWAAWGVDYLKYDWNPIELPETREMGDALRHSGRDIVFSLSNNMKLTNGPTCGKIANSWRTTGDIKANWKSMSERGFGQDKWRPYAAPGHWNDPDMLEIATKERNQPGLTPDEEYTHMTLWCLLSSPLLLANDLASMDAFTRNLLENDEVLAVNQDALGDQAVQVAADGDARVYARTLADGSRAVGLFNTGTNGALTVTVRWSDLKVKGAQPVRDLWRQKELGEFKGQFSMSVAAHGAEMVRVGR